MSSALKEYATELSLAYLPSEFAANVTGFTLDPWQVEALDFEGDRLIMNCCRQTGKTFIASSLAAHTAYYQKGSKTLVLSTTLKYAKEVFGRIMDIIRTIDVTLQEDTKQSLMMENGSTILCLSSRPANVRGYTPDLIIMDEASRMSNATYKALRPSLAVSRGKLILLSTPNGTEGFFWEEWDHSSEKWVKASITADECSRISTKFLEAERKKGERFYLQEYYCKFLEPSGSLFSADILSKLFETNAKPFFDADAKFETKIRPFNFERGK